MSFSGEVKEELSKLNNLANKEEVKYEFYGYLASDNITEENNKIKYSTENDYNIDRFAKIIRNLGMEDFDINVNGKIFSIQMENEIIPFYNFRRLEKGTIRFSKSLYERVIYGVWFY